MNRSISIVGTKMVRTLLIGLIIILALTNLAGCNSIQEPDSEVQETEEVKVISKEDFLGVWILEESIHNEKSTDEIDQVKIDLDNGESEYIAFTSDNRIYRLRYRNDNKLYSKAIERYEFSNETIKCQGLIKGRDDVDVVFKIENELLYSTAVKENTVLANDLIYKITDKSPDDIIFDKIEIIVTPAEGETVNYQEFDPPVFSEDKTLEEILDTNPMWVMAGIAANEKKANLIDEDEATFKLEDFEKAAYTVVFYPDGKLSIHGSIYNFAINDDSEYEIKDAYYCDQKPDEEGSGFRFYLGQDRLLYACYYYEEGSFFAELTDFLVLMPSE